MENQLAEIRDHFMAALERAGLEAQLQYVAEQCAETPEVRTKLEEMLRAHHQPEGFLVSQGDASHTGDCPVTEQPGDVIGPYKLLEPIGEGGMGVVYMAEQSEPVARRVALKIIKPGMDTRKVIARFEAERQALAVMDHPNIARVLDAGTTETGRPYFVMELVKGVTITEYCDEAKLNPRQRLELFIPVCQAVQHAHQKGIIHRDIKPSNVLVAKYDDRPAPKIIDFGVAKAIEQRLTEKSVFTEFGQVVGTIEYMSPEQAQFNQLDIDTRTDVYSLGVLLYELLVGETPFDRERLRSAAFDEMLRIIREEDPPKPSLRLSTSESRASIAASRQIEPQKLNTLVHGELDWIVMKALEKDRSRRYETAAGMARDVDRYLHDEPIEACPPSVRYRLWKFLSRNKGPVLAAGLLLLALVAGIIGTTLGLVRAERALANETKQAEAERQAKREALAAAEAERKAKQTAQTREAETRAVLDFVTNRIFAAARPEGVEGGLGRDVTLRQAVEASLPFVEKSFEDQPLIEAKLRVTLGLSYFLLGEDKFAHEQAQQAHALYAQHAQPEDRDALWSAHLLAISYMSLGRHAEAMKLLEETLVLRRDNLGADHRDTLQNMGDLASTYDYLGRKEDALRLNEETLALSKATLGNDHEQTHSTMGNLAGMYLSVGRYADALRLNEETLVLRRAKNGPDHPYTLWSMNNLAANYLAMGRYAEALKLGKETLALRQAKLGNDHRDTLMSMQIVADSYAALGQRAEALKHHEELFAQWEKKLGPDHRENVQRLNQLAWQLATCADATIRDPRRAVALAERAVKLAPQDGALWQTLAVAHYRASDWKAAVAALDKSILLGKGEDDRCLDWFFQAMAHWQLADKEEARRWYDKGVEWMERQSATSAKLQGFRHEAAELLGVNEPKTPPDPQLQEK